MTGILSALLAIMYLTVLIEVRKGTKFLFVIAISALMFVSNITGIIVVFSNYKILSLYDPKKNGLSNKCLYMDPYSGTDVNNPRLKLQRGSLGVRF